MPSLSLQDRLRTQFLNWETAPEGEVPELLLGLRAQGTPLILYREPYRHTFTAAVTKLLGTALQVELRNLPDRCDAFIFGGQVLGVGYGKTCALAFLTQSGPAQDRILQLTYPSRLLVRRGRQRSRRPLGVAVSAQWNRGLDACVPGDVMDLAWGDGRGGLQLVTLDDGSRPYVVGEMGRITLSKANGVPWEGVVELRRVDRMAVDARQDHQDLTGVPGFSLLGFAFHVHRPDEQAALEYFLDGVLEPD
ncbi:hypothetical protein [Acidithiobacillus caldus]|uniref:Uncharacterized protein n=1 Tax=Acidithiobacillus caldus TaxID=33059 RepID=A0A1E7YQQ2_9PROT|nr:hypothetical protein [Acidithiobacillus caldus]OFC38305.1 hypothetical protein BAE27_02275 [Acidithiobacillus caldus]OFC38575.1 hypothetical protein BAE28_05105 [Acidithiobacillus caldus]OFC41916.1 hypothetical protein BAE29_01440 [Acidithiobacillus caldus]